MTFKEYIQLAIRTDSKEPFLLENHQIKEITSTLFHSSLWIQTEVWEIFENVFVEWKWVDIDVVNLKEELWDIMWYAAIACNELELDIFEYNIDYSHNNNYKSIEEFLYVLNDVSIYILDSFKKSLLYNKPFDVDLFVKRMTELLQIISNLVKFIEWDLEKICLINIEKLQLRYPDKFTTEKSIDRDLDAEREILSQ